MQDYIATHLSEKITLCDLSCAAGYSPFYCARIFKELTGLAPADYIRRLRLSESALRLRDEQCKVIDTAYDFGYDSVDGYQRAFRNAFGCNPYEYAKSPIPLPLFTPYGVKFKTLWKEQKSMEHIANVFIQVVEKPERKVIIKRGKTAKEYWSYCQEVAPIHTKIAHFRFSGLSKYHVNTDFAEFNPQPVNPVFMNDLPNSLYMGTSAPFIMHRIHYTLIMK